MFRFFILLFFMSGMFLLLMPLKAQELTDKQRSLAGRYFQLEQILLRLAETSASSQQRQATLLKKALAESKDKLIVQRFETLLDSLTRRQFSDAVSRQNDIEQDLRLLLKILESADRDEQRNKEKEQVKEFLRDVEEILYNERALKNQTQRQESQNLPELEHQQRTIRTRTQTLQDRIDEYEGKPQENDPLSTESQQNPSVIQRAIDRMRQAEVKLKQAEKEQAVEEQEESMAELQRLKEELEKILRQLREEELMQTLTRLEERFKQMLQNEQTIRSLTETLLHEQSGESATDSRQIKVRADKLVNDQQLVIDDAEVVLLLLREDGTAQAIVESLLQVRFDMTEVKSRLKQTLFDTITLHIEDTVIDSLREMLDAVQEAITEAENRQNPQPQDGNMSGEEPLIQLLAELRMIRSMQRRVNERTERYDSEIKQILQNPDADLSPFKKAVEELARQQNRIARILHEIKVGKTQ